MTMYSRSVGAVLLAALCSASLRGQVVQSVGASPPYVDERTGIGLDDAIARALEREPGLRAERTEIEMAVGQRQQASLRPNPTVMVERRQEPGGSDRVTSVGLEWPLDLFRRQGRVRVADGELTSTRLAVADRERLLAAEVRLQYGLAAAAARDVSVAVDLADTLERQVTLARARVTEGALPRLDRDLLEVEARRFQAERALAHGRADVAILQLKQLLGMTPDEPLLLRDTLDTLASRTGPAAARAGEAPQGSRPDVLQAQARLAVAGSRVDQARRDARVDVSLVASYMRMDTGFPQFGVGADGGMERVRGRFNSVSGGALVSLPMLNRNQGEVARAQADRAGALARLAAAELAARTEVATAQARHRRAQEAVALYQGGIRELARANLEVIRQTFDLGRATVFDVLTEQRRYLDFEQAYATLLREAWAAHAALKRALGESK